VIVAWTGHRPELFLDVDAARAAVDETAAEIARSGRVRRFLVGGQRGVDTWAAQAALEHGVPLTLILPLPIGEFTADWPADDREQLERHTEQAEQVRVVGGRPAAAYTERNRLLAASADLLVAVWTGRRGGGTAETVAFARQLGTRVREVRLPASAASASATGHGI
jgi:predicted Rossmann fold nucleotide-binding protein DprA/Smf involved in DNA uptake